MAVAHHTSKDEQLFDLTEEQKGQLKEVFDRFDADGSGCITMQELGNAMMAGGLNPGKEELAAMIALADADQSGTLNFKEFVRLMAPYTECNLEGEMADAFSMFDEQGTGFVTEAKLRQVLAEVADPNINEGQEGQAQEYLDTALKDARAQGFIDEGGNINYTEFIQMLLGTGSEPWWKSS